jgi:hypothetical protein
MTLDSVVPNRLRPLTRVSHRFSPITLPVFETGSDPTRIPVAALFAPVAAAMLTALAGAIAGVLRGGAGAGRSAPRSVAA